MGAALQQMGRSSNQLSHQSAGIGAHCSCAGSSWKTMSRGGTHVAVLLTTRKRPPPSSAGACVHTPESLELTKASCSGTWWLKVGNPQL